MRNTVAVVALVAHSKGMRSITHLHWDTQRIWLAEFDGYRIIEAEAMTQEAARTPEAQSRLSMAQGDMPLTEHERLHTAFERQESLRIEHESFVLARCR